MLSRQFIPIQVYLKQQERHHINSLILHLKHLEKDPETSSNSKRKKIIQIRAKINEKEMKETIAKSVKLKAVSLRS